MWKFVFDVHSIPREWPDCGFCVRRLPGPTHVCPCCARAPLSARGSSSSSAALPRITCQRLHRDRLTTCAGKILCKGLKLPVAPQIQKGPVKNHKGRHRSVQQLLGYADSALYFTYCLFFLLQEHIQTNTVQKFK